MGYTDNMSPEMKQRIVQELVPGKQISLAHIIANPDKILYTKLGLDPSLDYSRAAIGIMTVSPAETAIIMADIAMKSSGIELGFVDLLSIVSVISLFNVLTLLLRKRGPTLSAMYDHHRHCI